MLRFFSAIILTLIFGTRIFSQFNPKLESYKHYSIVTKKDTIHFHIYCIGELSQKKELLVYLHGSGSAPLFNIIERYDTLFSLVNNEPKQKIQKSLFINSSVPFDLDQIPEDYAIVLISKKGIPFQVNNIQFTAPKSFYESESIDYRVDQADRVIHYIRKKLCKNLKSILVLGHSEGSDVAAKLAIVNKSITHLAFWSGGGPTQYYDFALFIRNEVHRGNITEADAMHQLDSLIDQIHSINTEPNKLSKQWLGHTYQRWYSFSEPSINNLLKVKIPIFIAMGAKDKSVPIESFYLIPIEFARLGKTNLTYKIYPEYDHSFNIPPKSEKENWQFHFMDVFNDLLKWKNQLAE